MRRGCSTATQLYLESEEGNGVEQPLAIFWHRGGPRILGNHEVFPAAQTVKQVSLPLRNFLSREPAIHRIRLWYNLSRVLWPGARAGAIIF